MMNSKRVTISLLFLAVIGGAGAYLHRVDPRPAIAAELDRAVADSGNQAPYAELVRQERALKGKLATVTVITPCFWSAEGRYGLVDGVYRTTPGFLGGKEVVRVEFDASQTSAEALVKLADPGEALPEDSCRINLDAVSASRADANLHQDDQPKFYLQQTELRFVPMTAAQLTRVNAYLHARKPYEQLLSPKQLELRERVRKNSEGNWTNYVTNSGM